MQLQICSLIIQLLKLPLGKQTDLDLTNLIRKTCVCAPCLTAPMHCAHTYRHALSLAHTDIGVCLLMRSIGSKWTLMSHLVLGLESA